MAENKTHNGIIVLGMHRSGTSLITKLCHMLGADLGGKVIPALANDNETGFWEHEALMQCNDAVNEIFGCHNDSAEFLPENYIQNSEVQKISANMQKVLYNDFGDKPCWVIKDPRTCRLLDLWKPLMLNMECNVRYLITVRHPHEVASSLLARKAIANVEQGYGMWFTYNLALLLGAENEDRYFVAYADVLNNTQSVMRGVEGHWADIFPKNYDDIADDVEQFINVGLRHHDAKDMVLPENVQALYDVMIKATQTQQVDMDVVAELKARG